MQRWFFANEREECQPEPEPVPVQESEDEKAKKLLESKIVYTEWPFCVETRRPLQGNEYIAITGNCDALGNWDPKDVIIMDEAKCACRPNCTCSKFVTNVIIPRNKEIQYRYCIVAFNPLQDDVIIRFWEVMPVPRIIRPCQNLLKKCDCFGMLNEANAEELVDRGWATTETYIHFKIFNAPFFFMKQTPRLLYVHIVPMFEVPPPLCHGTFLDMTNNTGYPKGSYTRRSTMPSPHNVQLAFTEVANLTFSTDLHRQPQRGVRCGPEDLQLYHFSLSNPEETLYRIDLYTYAYKAGVDEPPYHYGYGFVQPEQLRGSEGVVRIKITCASTHRPLIEMAIRYLIIRPMPELTCDMSVTYERYWPEKRATMDIGHRGTGTTYRMKDSIHRENTLLSFRRAAQHEADMVELDVQLTRDAQVVVYHDFVLRFSNSSAANVDKLLETNDVMIMPHEQFNRFRLLAMGGTKRGNTVVVPLESFYYDELRQAEPLSYVGQQGCDAACDAFMLAQLPFPLLSDVFDRDQCPLPDKVALQIELKWQQQDKQKNWQDQGCKPGFDRNFYVDTVLDVVFRMAGKRRIVFSSFDVDICIMLRFKQNYYPVILLTLDPDQPLQFRDQRLDDLEYAVHVAHTMQLLGLNLHANTIRDQTIILGHIRDLQMHCFTWGTPNNEEANRSMAKRFGIDGVVFDRIDQPEQRGEELQGYLYCVDSPATRGYVQALIEAEKKAKCVKK